MKEGGGDMEDDEGVSQGEASPPPDEGGADVEEDEPDESAGVAEEEMEARRRKPGVHVCERVLMVRCRPGE
jgi:hypothetical protein